MIGPSPGLSVLHEVAVGRAEDARRAASRLEMVPEPCGEPPYRNWSAGVLVILSLGLGRPASSCRGN